MIRRVTDYLEYTYKILPEKMAYTDGSNSLTFKDLRECAMKVACALNEEDLLRQPVVIFMEKSVWCISCFFGVAYSGNFYTPVDTTMPKQRVSKIVDTLKPGLVITDKKSFESAENLFEDKKILVFEDIIDKTFDEKTVLKKAGMVIDSDTLYVLFTSGSTGQPKGVIISHRSVIDYTDWICKRFDFNEETIIGNQAPLYFDLSIQDVYAPVCSGCTTHLISAQLFSFPKKLMAYLSERNVNTIIWIPTALCLMANLKALTLPDLPPIKKVLFCGEVMPNKQLNKWRKAYPDTTFVNLYGPTEACDASTYYIVDREFEDDEPLPIGIPCENTDVIILNENDELITGDEIGELCIRGSSLADGYYNDPEKTAEAFTLNPINAAFPERIYRTGDLVKYNEYGELEYVSRKDFQIKHLGYRIELGEIETAVSSLQGVELNCCLYDTKHSQIVLFYQGSVDEFDINKALEHHLPGYMIPGEIIKLEDMPRNANGKIDRAFLKNEIANL